MINEIVTHLNDPNVKTPLDQITVVTDEMIRNTLIPEIIEADREVLLKLLVISSNLLLQSHLDAHLYEEENFKVP